MTLSEVNQKERDRHRMNSPMGNIKKLNKGTTMTKGNRNQNWARELS